MSTTHDPPPDRPRHSAMVARAFLLAGLLVLLLVACGRAPEPSADPLAYEAEATSTTTVRVVFETDVDAGAEAAGSYRIDGGELKVHRAVRIAPDTVLLATDTQAEAQEYELTLSGISPQGVERSEPEPATFEAGTERAPVVSSALSLSATEILVTFTSPTSGEPFDVAPSGLEPAHYEVWAEGGGDGRLQVHDVAVESVFRGGEAAVVLTTEPQRDAPYTLRVTAVTTRTRDKLVDPTENEMTFQGIPEGDRQAPQLRSVSALSNTGVLVEFDEAMTGHDAPGAYAITRDDGEPLAVTEVEVTPSQALLTTAPQRDELTEYTLSVSGVRDREGNGLDPDPAEATFLGVSVRGPIDGDEVPPRVSNVASTSASRVLVTFTEPVLDGAENPEHYRINARLSDTSLEQQAVLEVLEAELDANRTTVELTTMGQSDIEYTLEVVNVRDLAGNQIAPPERGVDPSVLRFTGTAVSGAADDLDGDGLSDAAEQKGWIVTVTNEDGTTSSTEVTSDPTMTDTDEDGVPDDAERINGTNPRSADTDGDGLSDSDELNLYYSDPTERDTDGDGLRDGLEVNFFDISPIDADTDGDQLEDGFEVESANRDPRIADVPGIRIEVGDVALTLDERFTYTDTEGETQTTSSSTASTLEQGSERSYAQSDTQTMTSALESSVGAEVTYEFPKDFGASVETEVTTSSSEEYSSSVSEASSSSTNRAYNESIAKAQTIESTSEVQREVVDAAVRLPITIESLSDVAFTVENIEVTALQQDPVDRNRIIPVATLVPEVAAGGGSSPRYSVGPGGTKSNIVFVNREVFPNTVEDLMKDPRGLVFKVANYDLTDEMDRNFAYTQQDVIDRTASITIDYGDGRVDTHQVATYTGFDADGRPKGMTMDRMLREELGLDYATAPSSEVLDDGGDTMVLERVEDVAADVANAKSWVVFTSRDGGDTLDTDVDFGDIRVRDGEVYRISYMQDVDGDGLFARQEYLYGSDDTIEDTDGDGLGDYTEVEEGWPIRVVGQTRYRGYADPRLEDSDADGIPDQEERDVWGTDARLRDTDGDGLSDYDEINGFTYRKEGDLYDTEFDTPYPGESWVTNPLDPDTDGDGMNDGFEVSQGSNPQEPDAGDFIDTDQDGLSDREESEDCTIVVDDRTRSSCSSPYEPDTDDDGLPDLLERRLGTDPQRADTDGDGISDFDELDLSSFHRLDSSFDANQFLRDCDAADRCFYDDSGSAGYGSDPRDADSDWDGLNDYEELVQGWTLGTDGSRVYSDPLERDADGDGLDDDAERANGTDPANADTDGDGEFNRDRTDGEEVADGLDPTEKDQLLRVRLLNIYIANNSEEGGSELYLDLVVTEPDGTETFLVDWDGVNVNDGRNTLFDGSEGNEEESYVDFRRTFDDTFRINGSIMEEDSNEVLLGDNDCTQEENQYAHPDNPFDGEGVPGEGFTWEFSAGCVGKVNGEFELR